MTDIAPIGTAQESGVQQAGDGEVTTVNGASMKQRREGIGGK